MNRIFNTARRIFIGTTVIYSFGMILLAYLWQSNTLQAWWLDVSNIFALYLFAPGLLFILGALFLRSRKAALSLAAVSVVFLLQFGPLLIPRERLGGSGDQVRVLTANLLFSNHQADAVATAIRAQNADVVAFQELSPAISTALHPQLRAAYPYQVLEPAMPPYGLGIISRYPFRVISHDAAFPHQRITLDLNGRDVTLLNVHLSPPKIKTREFGPHNKEIIIQAYDTSRRAAHITALLDTIDHIQEPLIVLGDFNTSDREQAYTEFATRLHDAHRETAWGFGFTFPDRTAQGLDVISFPLIRIDYIWSGRGIVPIASRTVCDNPGADHCMVIADLRIVPTEVAEQPGHVSREEAWMP